jgi:hypothetical protein
METIFPLRYFVQIRWRDRGVGGAILTDRPTSALWRIFSKPGEAVGRPLRSAPDSWPAPAPPTHPFHHVARRENPRVSGVHLWCDPSQMRVMISYK